MKKNLILLAAILSAQIGNNLYAQNSLVPDDIIKTALTLSKSAGGYGLVAAGAAVIAAPNIYAAQNFNTIEEADMSIKGVYQLAGILCLCGNFFTIPAGFALMAIGFQLQN